eukprot:3199216-Rhodomonas_salina.1
MYGAMRFALWCYGCAMKFAVLINRMVLPSQYYPPGTDIVYDARAEKTALAWPPASVSAALKVSP